MAISLWKPYILYLRTGPGPWLRGPQRPSVNCSYQGMKQTFFYRKQKSSQTTMCCDVSCFDWEFIQSSGMTVFPAFTFHGFTVSKDDHDTSNRADAATWFRYVACWFIVIWVCDHSRLRTTRKDSCVWYGYSCGVFETMRASNHPADQPASGFFH